MRRSGTFRIPPFPAEFRYYLITIITNFKKYERSPQELKSAQACAFLFFHVS